MNLLERLFRSCSPPELPAVFTIEGNGEEPAFLESSKKYTVSGNDGRREASRQSRFPCQVAGLDHDWRFRFLHNSRAPRTSELIPSVLRDFTTISKGSHEDAGQDQNSGHLGIFPVPRVGTKEIFILRQVDKSLLACGEVANTALERA